MPLDNENTTKQTNGSNPSSNHAQMSQSSIEASDSNLSDDSSVIDMGIAPTLVEVRDRMGEVLERIKSRVEEMDSGTTESTGSSVENYTEEHNLQSKPNSSETRPGIPLLTTASNPPVNTLANDELAKRKAQIVAAARAAETKAREAEEKFRQIEFRLETEIEQRRTAEQRINGIEESYKKQIASLEAEGYKRLEAEETLEGVTARLDEETKARAEVEKALEDARARVEEVELALQEAEKKWAEAEAKAQALEESAREMEAKTQNAEESAREADAKAKAAEQSACEAQARAHDAEESTREAQAKIVAAEQTVRDVESMIYESDAVATEVQQKYKAVETRLRQEAELRVFAEQQLKALTDELNIELDVEWPKLESDIPHVTTIEQQSVVREEFSQQLLAQIETERQGRLEAERAREEAEKIASQARTALEIAEEKCAKAESNYEQLLHRHQTEMRKLQLHMAGNTTSQKAPVSSGAGEGFKVKQNLSMPLTSSDQVLLAASLEENRQNRISMIWYCTAILALVIILILLSFLAYRQL